MKKEIIKPLRKPEEIIMFVNGINQGMINEEDGPENFDLTEIEKILNRSENKETINNRS